MSVDGNSYTIEGQKCVSLTECNQKKMYVSQGDEDSCLSECAETGQYYESTLVDGQMSKKCSAYSYDSGKRYVQVDNAKQIVDECPTSQILFIDSGSTRTCTTSCPQSKPYASKS